MPKISIIIPVYNCEKYIEKCIDSVICQSFKDLEIILVDDGSSDRSGEICDEYLKKDERINVIHKMNGGLSSARNAGINIAKGRYIGFVDGDDYIEKDMYELLYKNICEFDADISMCGVYDKYNGIVCENKNVMDRCVLDNITAFRITLESKFMSVSAVNKIYKREIFNKFKYPEGKIYEDAFLTPIIIFNSKKIVYDPSPKYYYVHRKNSITTNNFKNSDLFIIEAYEKHLKFVRKNVPQLEKQAIFRYLWAHMVVIDKIIMSDNFSRNIFYKKIFNKLKKNIIKIILNPFFTKKRKLFCLILIINPEIYKMILLKNYKMKFKC